MNQVDSLREASIPLQRANLVESKIILLICKRRYKGRTEPLLSLYVVPA